MFLLMRTSQSWSPMLSIARTYKLVEKKNANKDKGKTDGGDSSDKSSTKTK